MINTDNIKNEFEALKGLRILVLGDVMIDSYLWGSVNRISPEAPVPIVSVDKREKRLGGAANVALNLKAFGADPIVLSVIGDDTEGQSLIDLFLEHDLSVEGLIKSKDRITTVKHRIISDAQHLLRVDHEQVDNISESLQEILFAKFTSMLSSASCVVFQDYDKGVLVEPGIKKCIEEANKLKIPTTVDPKKNNFFNYGGVTLFKPNLKELKEGLKVDFDSKNLAEVFKYAKQFAEGLDIKSTLVTLSEQGALLSSSDKEIHFPAHDRKILDVSGAGDTVIAMASACLALGFSNEKILWFSNLAGGLVCEQVGVVPLKMEHFLEDCTKH